MLLSVLTIAGSMSVVIASATRGPFYLEAGPPALTPLETALHWAFQLGPVLMPVSMMLLSGLPRQRLARNVCILGCCAWGLGLLWFFLTVGAVNMMAPAPPTPAPGA